MNDLEDAIKKYFKYALNAAESYPLRRFFINDDGDAEINFIKDSISIDLVERLHPGTCSLECRPAAPLSSSSSLSPFAVEGEKVQGFIYVIQAQIFWHNRTVFKTISIQ